MVSEIHDPTSWDAHSNLASVLFNTTDLTNSVRFLSISVRIMAHSVHRCSCKSTFGSSCYSTYSEGKPAAYIGSGGKDGQELSHSLSLKVSRHAILSEL